MLKISHLKSLHKSVHNKTDNKIDLLFPCHFKISQMREYFTELRCDRIPGTEFINKNHFPWKIGQHFLKITLAYLTNMQPFPFHESEDVHGPDWCPQQCNLNTTVLKKCISVTQEHRLITMDEVTKAMQHHKCLQMDVYCVSVEKRRYLNRYLCW